MFDTIASMAPGRTPLDQETERRTAVQSGLDRQLAPVTLANQQLLPVPQPLLPLFPLGGLQRGWSVGFDGSGSWSLAMALLGSSGNSSDWRQPSAGCSSFPPANAMGDGWVACVGLEALGLVAADEVGLRLDRVIMVENPPAGQWATVIAALVEVVDVICLGETVSVGTRDARRLMARAREQNAVLFHLDGGRSWPQVLDVNLSVQVNSWHGIGVGHGHLESRSVSVTAVGRRSMAKPRTVDILLPGPGGVPVADTSRSASPVHPVPVAGPVVQCPVRSSRQPVDALLLL